MKIQLPSGSIATAGTGYIQSNFTSIIYIYIKPNVIFYTVRRNLWMALRSQATVPSPPATSISQGLSPRRRHHSSAATGSRSVKSTT